jgi:hypothetical protein
MQVRAGSFNRPKGDVAGAASQVEQGKTRRAGDDRVTGRPAGLGRIDGGNEHILPGPVQPARHQVVHEVVAPRDAVKNVVNPRLFVFKRHLLEAEMGAFTGLRHGK